MLINYLIISILGSITILLPISYKTHLFIYQNLFNTTMFNNNTLNNTIFISIPISIIVIYRKDILRYLMTPFKLFFKNKKRKKEISSINFIIISSIISLIVYNLIPNLKLTIKNTPAYLFILSVILLLTNNKNGTKKIKDLSIKDTFIFGISKILTIIPSISPLTCNLISCKLLKLNKTTSIKISLLTLIPIYLSKIIIVIKQIIITENIIPYYLLSILISTIINISIINYLKDIYYNNKLYKLSIYLSLLGMYILYWYR